MQSKKGTISKHAAESRTRDLEADHTPRFGCSQRLDLDRSHLKQEKGRPGGGRQSHATPAQPERPFPARGRLRAGSQRTPGAFHREGRHTANSCSPRQEPSHSPPSRDTPVIQDVTFRRADSVQPARRPGHSYLCTCQSLQRPQNTADP